MRQRQENKPDGRVARPGNGGRASLSGAKLNVLHVSGAFHIHAREGAAASA